MEKPKEVQKTPENLPNDENSDINTIKEEDEEDETEKLLREERERRELQKRFDKFNNRVNKHILKELMKYVLEDFLDLFHMQQVELECRESGKCSAKMAAYKIIMNADTTETNAIIQQMRYMVNEKGFVSKNDCKMIILEHGKQYFYGAN